MLLCKIRTARNKSNVGFHYYHISTLFDRHLLIVEELAVLQTVNLSCD